MKREYFIKRTGLGKRNRASHQHSLFNFWLRHISVIHNISHRVAASEEHFFYSLFTKTSKKA